MFFETSAMMYPIPSPSGKFSGLKWNAALHGIIAVISGALMFYVFPSNSAVCRTIISVNLVLSILVYLRYNMRRNLLKESFAERPLPHEVKQLLVPNLYVVVYCFYLIVFLLVLYGLRPLQ
jgi:hypothetical protein